MKRDFMDVVQEAIEIRSASEFQCEEWTTAQWLTAIAGEVGELCNECKKEWRDGASFELDGKIQDEFADVFIYMMAFATHKNIVVKQAVFKKFNETSKKRGYKTFLRVVSINDDIEIEEK